MIAALGRFKTAGAAEALLEVVEEPGAGRPRGGGRGAGQGVDGEGRRRRRFAPLLADPAVEVRKAAIAALGALKDRASVPALIDAAGERRHPVRGVARPGRRCPTSSALGVYLRGLTDKSPDLRKASSNAIAAIRDEAAPVLEKLAARKELSPAALPELRKVFTRLRPVPALAAARPVPDQDRAAVLDLRPGRPEGELPGLRATNRSPGRRVRAVDGKGQVDLARVYKRRRRPRRLRLRRGRRAPPTARRRSPSARTTR